MTEKALEIRGEYGLVRRLTENLPKIRPCFGPDCGAMTRPTNITAADCPGTVTRSNGFYCKPCERRHGKAIPAELKERAEELLPYVVNVEEHREAAPKLPTEEVVRTLNRYLHGRQQRQRRAALKQPPYVRQ